jgi:hypothetical protein
MITDAERIAKIEQMSLEDLCRLNRFEPLGSPWFFGEVGKRFFEVLGEKRSADPSAWTAASKTVGWDSCALG